MLNVTRGENRLLIMSECVLMLENNKSKDMVLSAGIKVRGDITQAAELWFTFTAHCNCLFSFS